MFALRLEKFPIDYQLDHVVINDAAAVLCSIEHAVCTELVYQPGCPIGKTVNFIYRRIGEYLMIGAGVSQMPFDVLAYLSPVQVRQFALKINALPDGAVNLKL